MVLSDIEIVWIVLVVRWRGEQDAAQAPEAWTGNTEEEDDKRKSDGDIDTILDGCKERDDHTRHKDQELPQGYLGKTLDVVWTRDKIRDSVNDNS